jgi:hypothetical protein
LEGIEQRKKQTRNTGNQTQNVHTFLFSLCLEEQESPPCVNGLACKPWRWLFYTYGMNDLGRLLVGLGLLLLIIGGLILLLGRTGIPFGKLPGDISYRGKNVSFYFPLASSILLSIVLSLLFYLLSRFRR